MPTLAFLSYQTAERLTAGRVQELLDGFGIRSFMAHEDIDVSEEWRHKILAELAVADLFIPLLSRAYKESVWCIQESGIAATLQRATIIPLSLDGTIPPGFIGHIQSKRVDPDRITIADLLPGLAKHDPRSVIAKLTRRLSRSTSYRSAEADFELLLPYLGKASAAEKVLIVETVAVNGQVLHAGLVAREYLPPLYDETKADLAPELRRKIKEVIDQYSS